jgi:hypothetical protein
MARLTECHPQINYFFLHFHCKQTALYRHRLINIFTVSAKFALHSPGHSKLEIKLKILQRKAKQINHITNCLINAIVGGSAEAFFSFDRLLFQVQICPGGQGQVDQAMTFFSGEIL